MTALPPFFSTQLRYTFWGSLLPILFPFFPRFSHGFPWNTVAARFIAVIKNSRTRVTNLGVLDFSTGIDPATEGDRHDLSVDRRIELRPRGFIASVIARHGRPYFLCPEPLRFLADLVRAVHEPREK